MTCEEKDFIPISNQEMDDIIRNHVTEEVLENGFL